MFHAGLDLSCKRIDVCLIDTEGEVVGEFAVPADADELRAWSAAWARRGCGR